MNTLAIAQPTEKDETPLHLNVVGTFALLWSVVGVWRYLSFQSGKLDAATIQAWDLVPFYDLPNIVMATWALAVWCSVVGSNLLMVRSKLAVPAFTMALIGLIATSAYQFLAVPNPISIYETPFNLAAWIILIVSMLYTLRVYASGLLK